MLKIVNSVNSCEEYWGILWAIVTVSLTTVSGILNREKIVFSTTTVGDNKKLPLRNVIIATFTVLSLSVLRFITP